MNFDVHGTNFLLLLIPILLIVASIILQKPAKLRAVLLLLGVLLLVGGQFFKMSTPTPQVRDQLDRKAFDAAMEPVEKVIVEEKSFDERMREKELKLEAEGEARMKQFEEEM